MALAHVPELAMAAGPDRDRIVALRALRNCGVIRGRWDQPGFTSLMWTNDAEARQVRHDARLWDFRLTERGRRLAAEALKFRG